MQHLISADQFTPDHIELLFDMVKYATNSRYHSELRGKVMASLFLEPSLRTRFSFEIAMQKLGGIVTTSTNAQELSLAKGESIEDTVRTLSETCDVIVLRCPQNGLVEQAARASLIPVINAGDGSGEHPTQALLDLYTIKQRFELKNLTVMFCGDLLGGRTVHSLTKLLSMYPGMKFKFLSPDGLEYPEENIKQLKERGVQVEVVKYKGLDGVGAIEDVNVLYMTRLQKERIPSYFHDERGRLNSEEFWRLENQWKKCSLRKDDIYRMDKFSIVMHPLPRNGEIDPEIDKMPQAVYFHPQVRNGLWIRMTLLYGLFNGKLFYRPLY